MLSNAESCACVLINPVSPLAPREAFRLNRESYLKHSLAETVIVCVFVSAAFIGQCILCLLTQSVVNGVT